MRIEQTFTVARPPEVVFDYMAEPANLGSWQTNHVSAEIVDDGPVGQGTRIRERVKMGPREAEQLVEFSEYERGRVLATRIIEGPVKVDGRWTLEADGDGTRVHFEAWGPLPLPMRLVAPLVAAATGRTFRGYHSRLKAAVESG